MGSKKSNKKKFKMYLIKFSKIIWILSILFMTILGYFIFEADVLPLKYFLTIVIIFLVLILFYGFIIFKKKPRNWVLIFLNIFSIILISIEIFGISKINDTIQFFKNNLGVQYEINIYNIIVNTNANYDSIDSIKDQTVKVYKENVDMTSFERTLKEKVNVTIDYSDNVNELLNSVLSDTNLIIIVNSGNYEAYIDADKDYEANVKIIGTIEVKKELESVNIEIETTKEPFAIYLSGIDTRSGYMPSRSLSDVNIVLAVNPSTKRIIMIHIPRDYYVQLHGTTGLKDKLTHSGTIGGIELSMKTIENLLEIEIPYYIRVNFNAVVKLVDAIGGININSDVDYSFTCWTDKSCTFHPGLNSVDGRCALAFARERHAYVTGDRHRGENQEQILSLIINKVTSSNTIIAKYSEILKALDGTFQTNISMDEITSLIKMQIDDMATWQIETVNVDGTGAYLPTYSYPYQNLYVMNPNMDTVTNAVAKLNEVLDTP